MARSKSVIKRELAKVNAAVEKREALYGDGDFDDAAFDADLELAKLWFRQHELELELMIGDGLEIEYTDGTKDIIR